MSIEIKSIIDYREEINHLKLNIISINDIEETTTLKRKTLNEIYQILNNNDLKILCRNILKNKYLDNFSYQDLHSMYSILEMFFHNISTIKEKIDISSFIENGNLINIKRLKSKFIELNKQKEFPKFNFKRLKELFLNPPTKLKPMDNSSEQDIIYDPYVVRKYLYGIIQMVINEMDLLIGYTGAEGMGKSCGCSQDMNLVYYLLKELDLITYKYDINNMWFGNLDDFLYAEDELFEEKFRILGLDEGNELNRQDWQNDSVKMFFQRLRRERKNQRIKFICLPQLGELLTSIVLSRMNFIFNMQGINDIRTGTLDKGFCNFYIIPRSDKIYSPAQQREISKSEIIDTLAISLADKKKYLKEIPRTLLIKRFKKNYIWGFSRESYDKTLKEKNKSFTVSKKTGITEYQAYCYFKFRPKLKDWGIDRKENPEIYATLQKLDKSLCRKFEEDPKLLEKYENILKNNRERKGIETD